MARLRKERADKAEKLGLVKLRVDDAYMLPEHREKIVKQVARFKRDV